MAEIATCPGTKEPQTEGPFLGAAGLPHPVFAWYRKKLKSA